MGGYGRVGKSTQENIIFMRFCCRFKLSKKTEKLLNEQRTLAIAKCMLTGLVQQATKSCWKWDLKLCMTVYSAKHCFFFPLPHMSLEFKMMLPPAKKQKAPACIRERRVNEHWTKVYSQKGLTAMKVVQLTGGAVCWHHSQWIVASHTRPAKSSRLLSVHHSKQSSTMISNKN